MGWPAFWVEVNVAIEDRSMQVARCARHWPSSVIRIRNFQGFLNPGDHQKPAKTQIVQYSETYVCFSGNLAVGEGNPHYLPNITIICLGYKMSVFVKQPVYCSTQQLSWLEVAEKIFMICILHNFFVPDF
jgi:hypothetical protein